MKWIPPAMHIEVGNKAHKHFYELLKQYDLPLLCHIVPEYAFYEGVAKENLDNFRYLETPLCYGVKVITAHCAAPLLPKIINSFPPKWLVNGSDFPIPILGAEHLPLITYDITLDVYIDILNTKNPFDLDVKIKRAHGFADSILENAESVLRINISVEYIFTDWNQENIMQ